MRYAATALLCLALSLTGLTAHAHDLASARYIANEGLMAQHGDIKVLFDPFSVTGFGTYLEPSEADVSAMMAGDGEFAGIDAVFISHAHRDHFSAPDMIAYMAAQHGVHIVLPSQGVDMMREQSGWDEALTARMSILDMDYGDAPQSISLEGIEATAVRIAHAGWPAPHRASVQNMVYRITLGEGGPTIMHMGDADPNAVHYAPFEAHWDEQRTNTAFPPYWFLTRDGGAGILHGQMNVDKAIGIHVPIVVPEDLAASGADYFSVAGETREIGHD